MVNIERIHETFSLYFPINRRIKALMVKYTVPSTTVVSRRCERELLLASYHATRSQFIAVYGRRRIGKTLLVRETFGYHFTFQHAGLARGSMSQQLFAFEGSLREAGLESSHHPANWLQAFELLKDLIRQSGDERKLIFIDELSWMDTPRSDLMVALESFWNGWASARKDVVLIVCASATSWMLDKVVHNKGGLYNRLTTQIYLKPFTLKECEELLYAKGIVMDRMQTLECYMVMGGVPYYWDLLQRGRSLAQNIDDIFFGQSAPLAHEYDYLFSSLFKNPEGHLAIIKALATRKAGMTRDDLIRSSRIASSGTLTKLLSELESCGFIRRYQAFGKTKRDAIYQLIDNFTLFHHKFLESGNGDDEYYWSSQVMSPALNAWRGVAFERVCLEHVSQIKRALGISGVHTEVSSWTCKADAEQGIHASQIDLLVKRADNVINLCEMKYSKREYALTRRDEEALRHKACDFQALSKSRCAIHVTLVTTYGLVHNAHAGTVQSVVCAEDLFA